MSRKLLALATMVLALLPATAPARPPLGVAPALIGTWINPRGTVKVRTGDCAGNLCGWVVWAAPKAEADARDSGVTQLVGTELLRNYRGKGPGRYEGTVYVPDMGHSFYSTIVQRDADHIRISGCILGGLICKSQDWHRA